jgi:hypothetical protein
MSFARSLLSAREQRLFVVRVLEAPGRSLRRKLQNILVGPLPYLRQAITQFAAIADIDEQEVLDTLRSLCDSRAVSGSVRGRDFVPESFAAKQKDQAQEFMKANGYIEFSRARSLGVSEHLRMNDLPVL